LRTGKTALQLALDKQEKAKTRITKKKSEESEDLLGLDDNRPIEDKIVETLKTTKQVFFHPKTKPEQGQNRSSS